MFQSSTYKSRRETLKKEMGSGLLLFLGNDDMGLHYADNAFRYRQDSTFLYFFGISAAGLSAVIDIDNNRTIIFGDELTIDHIIWMGVQPTLVDKAAQVAVTDIRPSKELSNYLAQAKGQNIHHLPAYRAEHELKFLAFLDEKPGLQKASLPFMQAVIKQRNFKTPEELIEIECACNITADMHIAATKAISSDLYEYEIAALIEYTAAKNFAELSFPTIASINGQTLHNHYHGNKCKEGRLFLIDAGAEVPSGYAGDMSSTIPVSKHFTAKQRAVYEIQNKMHLTAVAGIKPGIPFTELHNVAMRELAEGMKNLGIMKGNIDDAVREGAHALFCPHGLGHMMGLDVHDMENFGEQLVGYDGQPKSTQFGRASLRLGQPLKPGFVHTIEPGIYFIPDLIDKWKGEHLHTDFINYDELEKYRDFGGIRNEEDYLVTETGGKRLGKKIPLTPDEFEALR